MKIVIADYIDYITKYAKNYFEGLGFNVTSFDYGEDTINYVDARYAEIDLIILDTEITRGDGIYTCTILKNNPKTKHIPIIMWGPYFQKHVIDACLKAGANKYIEKLLPITTELTMTTKLYEEVCRVIEDLTRKREIMLMNKAGDFEELGMALQKDNEIIKETLSKTSNMLDDFAISLKEIKKVIKN